MKIELKNIATIQTGLYAQTGTYGTVLYLQVKHFSDNGTLIDNIIPELPLNSQTEKHLLAHGDLIFAAKGSKNVTVMYNSNYGHAVASSSFLVIKIQESYKSTILPEYLCWYINHPKTQETIKLKARGSSIPSISKHDLEELSISIPPIEKQQTIIKIATLHTKEQYIIKQIQFLKDQYVQQRLISVI
jgi:restriction endonuclease S subunit